MSLTAVMRTPTPITAGSWASTPPIFSSRPAMFFVPRPMQPLRLLALMPPKARSGWVGTDSVWMPATTFTLQQEIAVQRQHQWRGLWGYFCQTLHHQWTGGGGLFHALQPGRPGRERYGPGLGRDDPAAGFGGERGASAPHDRVWQGRDPASRGL